MGQNTLKGEEYYTDESVAQEYDQKRFGSQGGQYIRETEREAFMALLGDLDGKKVLDVATGTGRLAVDMAEAGADVTATDISNEMLDQARAKAGQRGLNIEFFQGDGEDLDVDTDSFDIVTSQRFLHLVPDHRPYVEEMARIAREKIVYDYFNFWSLRILYDWMLPMGSYLHRSRKVNAMLRDVGLENIEEERRHFMPYGAIRNKSGPHISALIGLDRLVNNIPVARRTNSIIYVAGEV